MAPLKQKQNAVQVVFTPDSKTFKDFFLNLYIKQHSLT